MKIMKVLSNKTLVQTTKFICYMDFCGYSDNAASSNIYITIQENTPKYFKS